MNILANFFLVLGISILTSMLLGGLWVSFTGSPLIEPASSNFWLLCYITSIVAICVGGILKIARKNAS